MPNESLHPIYQVDVTCTGVFREASESSPIETEALYGELVSVIGFDGEWARVVTVLDKYPGCIRAAHLSKPLPTTHRISAVSAPLFRDPSFKTPLIYDELFMNSLVFVEETHDSPEGQMSKVRGKGWVFSDHLVDKDHRAADHIAEARKLLGTPYTWGKRSGGRYDCSSAMQAICISLGVDCPRDVSQQVKMLGEPVDSWPEMISESRLESGHLVFFTEGEKGRHVVLMINGEEGFHTTTAFPYRGALFQPLEEIVRDQEREGNGPITMVRRLPGT